MNRRAELARQLSEAKAARKVERQHQVWNPASSLLRCVFSGLPFSGRWSVLEDSKQEITPLTGNRLENGTPLPAVPPETVAAVSGDPRISTRSTIPEARLIVTCNSANEASP